MEPAGTRASVPKLNLRFWKITLKPNVNRTGKILIVDDTEVVAQLMSEYLRHKGYETFHRV